MTTNDFMNWLQGYLEAAEEINFSTAQQWAYVYKIKEALKAAKFPSQVIAPNLPFNPEEVN